MERIELILICIALSLSTGCRDKQQEEQSRTTDQPERALGPASPPIAAGSDQHASSSKEEHAHPYAGHVPHVPEETGSAWKLSDPTILWTGSGLAVVWYEWCSAHGERVRMMMIDEKGERDGDIVELKGAGSGPKGLDDPEYTAPVWFRGAVYIGWRRVNLDAECAMGRNVVASWNPDGEPQIGPVVVAKVCSVRDDVISLFASPSAVHMAWPEPFTDSSADPGGYDCVTIVRLDDDGGIESEVSESECVDVLGRWSVHNQNEGLLSIMVDFHVAETTRISTGYLVGTYLETTEPVKEILVTSEGVAVWYTILAYEDSKLKHDKHCLDIFKGKKMWECIRYKSRHLRWTDEGLFWEIESKSGNVYTLSYSVGEHVPPKAVRRMLVKKVAVMDAVWTGHSIGITAITNNTIRHSIINRDGATDGA